MNPTVLYTFSSLQYLDDLKAGRLWFAPTRCYNDIFEDTIFVQGDSIARQEAMGHINKWINTRVVRCFTTDPSNPLMWAHYADSHRGVCVGYRYQDIYLEPKKDRPGRSVSAVQYSSSPPRPFVARSPEMKEVIFMALNVMLTKSIHWAYEQEYRAFTVEADLANAGGGLIELGSVAAVEVIFGSKVDQSIINKFNASSSDNVRYRVARKPPHGTTYDLQIADVSRVSSP